MQLALALISLATSIVGFLTAWVNFQSARRPKSSSNSSENRSSGGFWSILFTAGGVLIGLAGLLSLVNSVSAPDVHAYCCDGFGNARCPLTFPLPPATPCFCPYQGNGFTCYR